VQRNIFVPYFSNDLMTFYFKTHHVIENQIYRYSGNIKTRSQL